MLFCSGFLFHLINVALSTDEEKEIKRHSWLDIYLLFGGYMRRAAAAGWKESKHGCAPKKKIKRSFSRCRETETVEEQTKQADVQVDISFTSWTNRE